MPQTRSYYMRHCPFCGSCDVHLDSTWPHRAYCAKCAAQVKSTMFAEQGDLDAVQKWNARKVVPEQDGVWVEVTDDD